MKNTLIKCLIAMLFVTSRSGAEGVIVEFQSEQQVVSFITCLSERIESKKIITFSAIRAIDDPDKKSEYIYSISQAKETIKDIGRIVVYFRDGEATPELASEVLPLLSIIERKYAHEGDPGIVNLQLALIISYLKYGIYFKVYEESDEQKRKDLLVFLTNDEFLNLEYTLNALRSEGFNEEPFINETIIDFLYRNCNIIENGDGGSSKVDYLFNSVIEALDEYDIESQMECANMPLLTWEVIHFIINSSLSRFALPMMEIKIPEDKLMELDVIIERLNELWSPVQKQALDLSSAKDSVYEEDRFFRASDFFAGLVEGRGNRIFEDLSAKLRLSDRIDE